MTVRWSTQRSPIERFNNGSSLVTVLTAEQWREERWQESWKVNSTMVARTREIRASQELLDIKTIHHQAFNTRYSICQLGHTASLIDTVS